MTKTENSLIITLPSSNKERVDYLAEKMVEYWERLNRDDDPLTREDMEDMCCRIEILSQLLSHEEVDVESIRNELSASDSGYFSEKILFTAAIIILDYVQTGGKNLWHGP